jgi:hypothetical protein
MLANPMPGSWANFSYRAPLVSSIRKKIFKAPNVNDLPWATHYQMHLRIEQKSREFAKLRKPRQHVV